MSAATPDYVLQAIYNNAKGIGIGPVMKQKEAQAVIADLGGWFTWYGTMVDITAKSVGAGMYALKGKLRSFYD